jgi:heat shock protein HtpX
LLDEEELAGVLAHELGHVRNRDTLIMTVAATLAGAITMLAHMAQWGAIFGMGRHDDEDNSHRGVFGLLFMAIVAPIAATLIQLAISRSREYFADRTGAAVAWSPSGLARALEKLHDASQQRPMGANPATAHLFILPDWLSPSLGERLPWEQEVVGSKPTSQIIPEDTSGYGLPN